MKPGALGRRSLELSLTGEACNSRPKVGEAWSCQKDEGLDLHQDETVCTIHGTSPASILCSGPHIAEEPGSTRQPMGQPNKERSCASWQPLPFTSPTMTASCVQPSLQRGDQTSMTIPSGPTSTTTEIKPRKAKAASTSLRLAGVGLLWFVLCKSPTVRALGRKFCGFPVRKGPSGSCSRRQDAAGSQVPEACPIFGSYLLSLTH